MKPAVMLLLLLAAGAVHAQVPTDWDKWVADGLTAEDNSEYKDAERLFRRYSKVALPTWDARRGAGESFNSGGSDIPPRPR